MDLPCVYAALILLDDDMPVTGDKISTILKAAGVTVDSYWPTLFAKASNGMDLKGLLNNLASGVGSGVAAAPAAATTDAAPAAAKKVEKVEEPEEESDDDMGFGLFD